ncbi:hypothetical protein CATMIT_01786, partial [Catenibacterium mitsuokai DSM 15897]
RRRAGHPGARRRQPADAADAVGLAGGCGAGAGTFRSHADQTGRRSARGRPHRRPPGFRPGHHDQRRHLSGRARAAGIAAAGASAARTGPARASADQGDSASGPLLPLWDGNPEVIAIDSSTSGSGPLQVAGEARLRDAGGVLSVRNGRYTLLMSSDGKPLLTAPGMTPRSADDDRDSATSTTPPLPPLPADRALSIAYYDLERMFDIQDDPRYADEVITVAAYERNLRKAALGIRR